MKMMELFYFSTNLFSYSIWCWPFRPKHIEIVVS